MKNGMVRKNCSNVFSMFLNCRKEICDWVFAFFFLRRCDFLACFDLNWTHFFAVSFFGVPLTTPVFLLFSLTTFQYWEDPFWFSGGLYCLSHVLSPVARWGSCRFVKCTYWNRWYSQIVLSCIFFSFGRWFCTYTTLLSLFHRLTDVSSWLSKSLR